ncbi:MFS transporter [Sphaerisporangium dianthi]|uniref:MFS transporter n=1 Tax=Sphaerisporangium dianthi TaxID=1436120 RepID=A0ABV9C962_9ACTN
MGPAPHAGIPGERRNSAGPVTVADPGRRAIVVIIVMQLAISIGFFAVMAHLVAHLRHDLGLLAGTVSLVLGLRVAVQYMLFLPAGALADAIGPGRAGALACALRAGGFALLGTATGLGGLLLAAVVLAVGGALFHPSAQSLLAGVAPARRSRGFAAYLIAGQVGAVAGPPAGLLLLSVGGFGTLSALAVVAWTGGAVLFLLLPPVRGTARRTEVLHDRPSAGISAVHRVRRSREPSGGVSAVPREWAPRDRRSREPSGGISAVLRDRRFLVFAVTVAPATLLADQVVSVVPLKEVGGQASTLFFCVVAMATAAVQPWCAAGGRAERPWVLRSGLLCAGAGYLLLLAIPSGGVPPGGAPPAGPSAPMPSESVLTGGILPAGGSIVLLTLFVMAAVLHGLASGLTQSALFQTVTRRAPSGRFGTYFGLLSFLGGAVALVGGFTVGRLFDAGGRGEVTALIGLAAVAALSATAVRAPQRPSRDRHGS